MIGQQLVGTLGSKVIRQGHVQCSGDTGHYHGQGKVGHCIILWSTKSQEPGLTHDSKGTQGKRETCLRALWIKQNEGGTMLISVSNTLGK